MGLTRSVLLEREVLADARGGSDRRMWFEKVERVLHELYSSTRTAYLHNPSPPPTLVSRTASNRLEEL